MSTDPAQDQIVLQTSPDIGMFSVNAYPVDATQPVQAYSLQGCGAVTPLFDMVIMSGGGLFYGYDCGGGLVQSGYAGGTILGGSAGTPLISLAMMPDGSSLAIGTDGFRYQGVWAWPWLTQAGAAGFGGVNSGIILPAMTANSAISVAWDASTAITRYVADSSVQNIYMGGVAFARKADAASFVEVDGAGRFTIYRLNPGTTVVSSTKPLAGPAGSSVPTDFAAAVDANGKVRLIVRMPNGSTWVYDEP
ncbi:hypothetical protein [Cupriavidus sp. 2SB]|uniref:hypothetical protein n=1 Tax=unclassified Cupriavidus TaxID=2640874 RepID=UPI0010F8F14A|nr:hypothetical protein [Cupriavidus sp. 2SB]